MVENYIWHPCSQMKDYELFKPLEIKRAYGSYFELKNGQKIIDAISSWWCKSLGHNHPALKQALQKQLDEFEHVILANTTNDTILKLSQVLAALMPNQNPRQNKVFYASDGSSAVEIALKMSLHSRVIQNQTKRSQFIALKNGYHGETLGALSVSDVGIFREPYNSYLFNPIFIDVPYVLNTHDPEWENAEAKWQEVEKQLEPYAETATAIIFEPILQGSVGMKLYSKDFLERFCNWASKNNIHIIADEIMTGLGRTGKMLGIEYTNIKPDFVCLSKGLTSGWLPLSAVLTTNDIYQHFYDDYETGKTFMHSHTFSGNALAASVALATIEVIKQDNLSHRANQLQDIMMQHFKEIAEKTGRLCNLRGIGGVVAADLVVDHQNQKEQQRLRLGYKVFQEATKLGAYLRPLGNTIYWLPPLNIELETLESLKVITLKAIKNANKSNKIK